MEEHDFPSLEEFYEIYNLVGFTCSPSEFEELALVDVIKKIGEYVEFEGTRLGCLWHNHIDDYRIADICAHARELLSKEE